MTDYSGWTEAAVGGIGIGFAATLFGGVIGGSAVIGGVGLAVMALGIVASVAFMIADGSY